MKLGTEAGAAEIFDKYEVKGRLGQADYPGSDAAPARSRTRCG